jgi:GNAT superfamily N-acetyltransferase
MRTRLATADEVGTFGDWALSEGWMPGVGDVDAFFAADAGGFHVLVDDDERIVSTVSVVRYGESDAFLGFYIVDPALRGRGYGLRVWQAGLAGVPDRRVGLDGVAEQIGSYEKSGFVFSHWTPRFTGSAADIVAGLADAGSGVDVLRLDSHDSSRALADDLLAYDSRFVPTPRPAFVHAWLAQASPRSTFVAMRDGTLAGYATVRPALPSGARIGPLFADDDAAARALLLACAREAVAWGDPIAIDVPERNATATALVESLGMTPGFSCARMWRGPAPALPYAGIWGSTTFELG